MLTRDLQNSKSKPRCELTHVELWHNLLTYLPARLRIRKGMTLEMHLVETFILTAARMES